jgi:hypothetical protein
MVLLSRVNAVAVVTEEVVAEIVEIAAVLTVENGLTVEIEEDVAVNVATEEAAVENVVPVVVADSRKFAKMRTASLWKLGRSPRPDAITTEAVAVSAEIVVTLEAVVATVVIVEIAAVVTVEIGYREVAVAADLKLREVPTPRVLLPRNNSPRLRLHKRRRARTDKVKCE